MPTLHRFSSIIPDNPAAIAAGKVPPSEWNRDHIVMTPFDVFAPDAAPGNYTPETSGIFVRDGLGNEIFRIWGTDPDFANNYNAANLYIGFEAGRDQPTANDANSGFANTAVGTSSQSTIRSGVENTSVGFGALWAVTDGFDHTAVGAASLPEIQEGQENTAFGAYALCGCVNTGTDGFNTAIGGDALSWLTTGKNNTALGTCAGSFANLDGRTNLRQQRKGGSQPRSRSNDMTLVDEQMVLLGASASRGDLISSDVPMINGIAIGFQTRVEASNTAVIGNADVTDVYFGSVAGKAVLHAFDVNIGGTFFSNSQVDTDKFGVGLLQLGINNFAAAQPYRSLMTLSAYATYTDAGVLTEETGVLANAVSSATIFSVDLATNVTTFPDTVVCRNLWVTGSLIATGGASLNGPLSATTLVLSGQSVTGSASDRLMDISTTWNTTGSPAAIILNVNNTASAAASRLLDLRVASVSKMSVDLAGTIRSGASSLNGTVPCIQFFSGGNVAGFGFPNSDFSYITAQFNGSVRWALSVAGPRVDTSGYYAWTNGAAWGAANVDTALGRNAAGVVEVNNGTAGTFADLKGRNSSFTNNSYAQFFTSDQSLEFFRFASETATRTNRRYLIGAGLGVLMPSDSKVGFGSVNFSGTGDIYAQIDTVLSRESAGVLRVVDWAGTAYRDLKCNAITLTNPNFSGIVISIPGATILAHGTAGKLNFGNPADGDLMIQQAGNYPVLLSAGLGRTPGIQVNSVSIIGFASGTLIWGSTADVAFARNAAGVIEINNGTAGQFRDLKLRSPIYAAPAADGEASGPVTSDYNAGYTTAIGDLVYLDASATWQKADANASYDGMPGIVLTAVAAGLPVKVALPGSTVWAAAKFGTFNVGRPVYMSELAGAVTQTKPITPDSATRVLGWAVHPNKMYFYPSQDYGTVK